MNEKTTSAAELIATLESIAVGDSCFHVLARKSPATCAASVERNRAAIATVQEIIEERDALRAAALAMNPPAIDWSRTTFAELIMPRLEGASKGLDAALRATNPAQDKTKTDEIEIPEGFTAWPGGKCPVHADTCVHVVLREGSSDTGPARWYFWGGTLNSGAEIIAYRVVTP